MFLLLPNICPIAEHILPLLGNRLKRAILSLGVEILQTAEEIRIRPGYNLLILGGGKETWLPPTVVLDDLTETLNILSQYSYYAFSQQLAQGYVTVAGGHRVGVAGRVTVSQGKVLSLVEVGSMNIRIARQIKGVGEPVFPFLFSSAGMYNTLILAAPTGGKTTLLRDLIRLASDNALFRVGIADERSELAGCYRGIPQLDVGQRTDVIDGCPRDQGLEMLVRSMGPQVVAADEIGRKEDVRALETVLAAGVALLTTAHAGDLSQAYQRPLLKGLLGEGFFQRGVILQRVKGIPTVKAIVELPGGRILYGRRA